MLVILAVLFLPQSARTAANSNVASADSDSAYFVGEATADSDGVYVENKEEVFFNQTVKYTGTVLANPDPGRFYPCDDNGELTFSDGRKYKGPFNRGRMEGDNATFIYPMVIHTQVLSMITISQRYIYNKDNRRTVYRYI